MTKRKKNKIPFFKKLLIVFFVLLISSTLLYVFSLYQKIYEPNILFSSDSQEQFIFIPSDADFNDVVQILNSTGLLININSFEFVAKQKNYVQNIKPGKYQIKKALSNNELINLLRSGNQTVVNLTFNNLRNKEEFAGVIANQLEIDSIEILDYFKSFIRDKNKLELTDQNIVCLFIPNTYEFYWNVGVGSFMKRMLKENNRFWNEERKNKLAELKKDYSLDISRYQVSILASIVEKEQNIKIDERPMIAGLYLNRLKKKMKLESDPTLIFALSDFGIKRVLNKDKKIESPYNTYQYKGLPPGPICIPSINSIDAVLNAVSHNYIFMCAKPDFSGYHNFARTYTKHKLNARKYQRALNKRKIMR
ncbi:MAG: endolytic transglycosylase MltG [Bacteroidota bacterium]|nr:endolytic transglycosylase MltG [Bacteroidota bacterium]